MLRSAPHTVVADYEGITAQQRLCRRWGGGEGGLATKRVQTSGLRVALSHTQPHLSRRLRVPDRPVDLSAQRSDPTQPSPAINAPASGAPEPPSEQNALPCALRPWWRTSCPKKQFALQSTVFIPLPTAGHLFAAPQLPASGSASQFALSSVRTDLRRGHNIEPRLVIGTDQNMSASAASLRQAPTTVRHTSTPPQKPHARSP